MVEIPGGTPPIPPHIPKEGKAKKAGKAPSRPAGKPVVGRGAAEMDAHAIAVALAAAAKEAKEKELSFTEILQRVMDETGITNPQAAMEEANRKLQEEIEYTIEEIKANKDLMEEAEAWEAFGEILESRLSQEQIQEFFMMLTSELKGI